MMWVSKVRVLLCRGGVVFVGAFQSIRIVKQERQAIGLSFLFLSQVLFIIGTNVRIFLQGT